MVGAGTIEERGRCGSRRRVEAMPVERLGAEVVALAERLAVGTYELLVLVGEVDARGAWAAWGAVSCAAWLASACDVEVSTARSQVRVARALRDFPVLDAAMRGGDVSYAKARVLAAHLTERNAAELVGLAAVTPAGRLGAAVAGWSLRHEDPGETDRRQHEARSVAWRTDADGMVTFTVRLPPTAAATLAAVIDHQVVTSRAPAGASLAQQRADALVAAATTGGTAAAEVVVHVRGNANTLADGTPLSDHAVASMLPEAFVSLLVHDMAGRPIDASPRRRSPTRRQRRVLDEAQPTCRHPGCEARTFLQYDHIRPYHVGGPTTLDNLQRLCGPHNRARQRG